MRRVRIFLSVLSLIGAGCTSPMESDSPISRADLENGKFDVDLQSRVCQEAGMPAGCDPCEANGYYDDGQCDFFCHRPDGDCRNVPMCGRIDAAPETGDGGYDFAQACCWVSSTSRHTDYSWCTSMSEVPAPITWTSGDATYHMGKLSTGPSGKHRVGFAEPTLAFAEFASDMRVFDRDQRGCEDRAYSTSRERGVGMYHGYVAEHSLYEGVSNWNVESLDEIVDAAENRAVFASVPAEGSSRSDCAYADFFVFRPGRQVAHFYFDFRDPGSYAGNLEGPQGITYLGDENADIANIMQAFGHNGGSSIGIYDPSMSYEQLADFARAYDNVYSSCVQRMYSESSERALLRLRILQQDPYDYVYLDESEENRRSNWHKIVEYINRSDNVQVLSSEFGIEDIDYSEMCLIWNWWILRPNGTVVRFEINHTD